MLLYIPLLSSLIALYQLGSIGVRWFFNEILISFLMLISSGYALYFDNIYATITSGIIFVCFFVLPMVLRNSIARKMLDPSEFKAFHLFKILSVISFGKNSRVNIHIYNGLIFAACGNLEKFDNEFSAIDKMDPPTYVSSIVYVEHLRGLALSHQWEKVVATEIRPELDEKLKPSFHLWHSQGFIALHRFKEGLQVTLTAFELAPSIDKAMFAEFNIMTAIALSGQFENTLRILESRQFLEGDLGHVFSWYWIGRCHFVRCEYDRAVICFSKASEANLTVKNTYWKIAIDKWLLKAQQEDKAASDDIVSGSDHIVSASGEEIHGCNESISNFDEVVSKLRDVIGQAVVNSEYGYVKKATWFLIVALIVIYCLQMYSGAESSIATLLDFGAFMPTLFLSGDYYRAVTAIFLHGSLLHLSFNILALKIFGPFVENRFGSLPYIGFFVITGVIGNLCGLYPERFMIAVGASGGVMGILGATMVLLLFDEKSLLVPQRSYKIKNLVFLLVANLVIGQMEAQVFNGAHIGGFFAGAALGLFVSTLSKIHSKFSQALLFFFSVVGLFLIGFGMLGLNNSSKTDFVRVDQALIKGGKYEVTEHKVCETAYKVEVPSHWPVESDKNVLRVFGYDGTKILFFTVPIPEELNFEKESNSPSSNISPIISPHVLPIYYVGNLCYYGQEKLDNVTMKSVKPFFSVVNGRDIAFWESKSENVLWHDRVELLSSINDTNRLYLFGRIVTPDSAKEFNLKLFNLMVSQIGDSLESKKQK